MFSTQVLGQMKIFLIAMTRWVLLLSINFDTLLSTVAGY